MINKQCNHLQDVQIEVDNSQEISILIGADYPYLHKNRDRRNATAMNPEIYQHPYDRFYRRTKYVQTHFMVKETERLSNTVETFGH